MPPDEKKKDEGFLVTAPGTAPKTAAATPPPSGSGAPAPVDNEGFLVIDMNKKPPGQGQGGDNRVEAEAHATRDPPNLIRGDTSLFGGPVGAPKDSMVQGPLSNAPGDTYLDSIYKGGITALTRGSFAPVGMWGDLRDFVNYGLDRGEAYLKGITYEDQARISKAKKERMKNSGASWQKWLPDIMGNLPTTGELSDEFFRQTNLGKYEPTTLPGKILMGAVEAGTGAGTTGSFGANVTTKTGKEAMFAPRPAPPNPSTVMRTGDKMVLPSAGAGAVSTAATEITGDPLVGAAAGIVHGPIQGGIVEGTKKFTPAFTKGQQQRQGDRTLTKMADDPESVAGYVKPEGELAGATTGTATSDKGLIIGEHTLMAADPKLAIGVKNIEAEANTARVKTIEDLGNPDVRPKDLADHFVNRKDLLEKEGAAAVAAAEERARNAVTPEGKPIEDIGAKAHDEGKLLADKSKQEYDNLYKAVDPDGKLNAVSSDLSTAAEKLNASRDPHIPPEQSISGFVQPVMDAMMKLPQVVPFQTLKNFDTWVTNQIALAKAAGDKTSMSQLGQLKQAIDKGMTNVLENQVKWEQQQVKAGAMKPEDTIGARLKADAERFSADRKGAKSAAVATVLGPDVVPPLTPNLDPQAAVRYQQAKQAFIEHQKTFNEGIVGKALGKSGYEDRQTAAQIAGNLFKPGDEGATNVNAWMRAAATSDNPSAVHAVAADAATTRLREMTNAAGGTLTPEVLAKWKNTYANALRAMDEHIPGFSSRFDDAATATTALGDAAKASKTAVDAFQKSEAGKIAGLTSGDDVTRHIGGLITDKAGATKLEALVKATDGNPQALAGIQSSAVDWMLGKTANAGMAAGENIMSSAKMRALVRDRPDALKHIFGEEGFANIQRVVDSLERDAHAATTRELPGPATARLLKPIQEALANKHASPFDAISLGALIMDINWSGGVATGAIVVNKFRQWLVQHGINKSHEFVREGLLNPEIGAIMVQRGLDERGLPSSFALSDMAALMQSGRVGASQLGEREETERNERRGRAAGGRTTLKLDCASKASKLCREAELIRKKHGGQTKAYLNVPDDVVASALRVAGGRLH